MQHEDFDEIYDDFPPDEHLIDATEELEIFSIGTEKVFSFHVN